MGNNIPAKDKRTAFLKSCISFLFLKKATSDVKRKSIPDATNKIELIKVYLIRCEL